MNGLIGRLLILAALGSSAAGTVVGLAAGRTGSTQGLRWTRWFGYLSSAFFVLATLTMEFALVTHDFSVSYVAEVGSRATPLYITIVSLWSSLEGSILFWGLILGVYALGFTLGNRHRPSQVVTYTLGTIMAVQTFFAFLLAGPANPFGVTPGVVPLDGPGPNPLLQNHPLMIVHPPMLYLGYVGMTVPFAMGVAALLAGGQIGADWMARTRRWMLLPWGFLTAGIVLGAWWAYEVLGWGGYWAWDPVENASLLPWLTATAFLHAVMLHERRGLLQGWAIVLLMVTFSLTILGTFMTRSGVFNSVHSFTQSPIGPTFLVFLVLVLLTSMFLVATRWRLLAEGQPIQSPLSREASFVVNNLLFVALTFAVLVGTTFPLVAEAVRGVKVSVGEPFFDQFAVPLGVAIVFLMGVGPALPWGRSNGREALSSIALPLGIGGALAAIGVALGVHQFWPAAALLVVGFAISVSVRQMITPILALRRRQGGSLAKAAISAVKRGRRRYGGQIVHIGVGMAVFAIAISSAYRQSTEAVIRPGQSLKLADYEMTFVGVRAVSEPHRDRTLATFQIRKDGVFVGTLEPAMNQYFSQRDPVGTPAVRTSWRDDLYLSLMQIDPENQSVGLRAYVNPAVAWLWIAMFVMVTGGAIAGWPARNSERANEANEELARVETA